VPGLEFNESDNINSAFQSMLEDQIAVAPNKISFAILNKNDCNSKNANGDYSFNVQFLKNIVVPVPIGVLRVNIVMAENLQKNTWSCDGLKESISRHTNPCKPKEFAISEIWP